MNSRLSDILPGSYLCNWWS